MRRYRFPWVIWAVSLALVAAGGYLLIRTGGSDPGMEPLGVVQAWIQLVASMAFSSAGAAILSRRPRHIIGWLFIISGVFAPTQQIAIGYAAACVQTGSCQLGALVLVDVLWFPVIAIGLGGLFLLFPDAQLPGGHRRLHWWALVGVMSVSTVASLLQAEVYHLAGATNPWAIQGWSQLAADVADASGVVVLFLVMGAVVDFGFRSRREDGVRRLQIRWLVWAGFLTVCGGVLSIVGEELGVDLGWTWAVGVGAIPVAVAIAILRYRLYDIDRIISRTVTYALVVGLLGLAVAGIAALAGSRFDQPFVVAATTLAVAAMFNPLRRRTQVWVDRRFNRPRYDAQRVVDEFTGSLRDRVDPDEVMEGWLGVVDSTMQPTDMRVWLRG